jgi:hypothetical protein
MMIRRNRAFAIVNESNSRISNVHRHDYVHIKIGVTRRRKCKPKKSVEDACEEELVFDQMSQKSMVRALWFVFCVAVGIILIIYSRKWPTSDPDPYAQMMNNAGIRNRTAPDNDSLKTLSSLASKMFSVEEDVRFTETTRKPQLIIHIGPPKTGSTSLQADLTSLQDYLRKDGFIYLGRLYKPYSNPKSGKLVLNRRPDSPALTALRNMFSTGISKCHETAIMNDCTHDFRKTLEEFSLPLLQSNFHSARTQQSQHNLLHKDKKFRMTPLNFLISDEALLKMWNTHDSNTTIKTWTGLYESLTDAWDVTIVTTYRRFFDWLPSAKAQRDKPTLERRRSEWVTPDSVGEALHPLFSLNLNTSLEEDFVEWRRNHFLSDTVFRVIKTLQKLDKDRKFNLKIFHLYGRQPLTTTFLCKVLALNGTCNESRARDRIKGKETRLNSRDESGQMAPTSILPLAFYDTIGTDAANRGLINTSAWSRHQVAVILQDFDATVRQRAQKLGLNHVQVSLPLKCPTTTQLRDLFELSLRIEADYMPKLFNRGLLDQKILFQSKVESKAAYCWIDTEKILSLNHDASPIAPLWLTYIRKQFA